jgi:hypothetical protein
VPVLNDNLVEPIETFVLRLTLPQNAQFANASPALYAITRIVDNDYVLDVDGNGAADALTDGLLIIRHLFGFTGDALINGVVDPAGARATAQLAEEFLAQISARLDVDGNGVADALTDGILIIRFLFGFTGDALTSGAVDNTNGTRTTAAEIERFLQGFLPGATAVADAQVAPTNTSGTITTSTTDSTTVVLDTTTTTSAVNMTTTDTTMSDTSLSMSLAYVQRSWLKDFVTSGTAVVEDEKELLIALPG